MQACRWQLGHAEGKLRRLRRHDLAVIVVAATCRPRVLAVGGGWTSRKRRHRRHRRQRPRQVGEASKDRVDRRLSSLRLPFQRRLLLELLHLRPAGRGFAHFLALEIGLLGLGLPPQKVLARAAEDVHDCRDGVQGFREWRKREGRLWVMAALIESSCFLRRSAGRCLREA